MTKIIFITVFIFSALYNSYCLADSYSNLFNNIMWGDTLPDIKEKLNKYNIYDDVIYFKGDRRKNVKKLFDFPKYPTYYCMAAKINISNIIFNITFYFGDNGLHTFNLGCRTNLYSNKDIIYNVADHFRYLLDSDKKYIFIDEKLNNKFNGINYSMLSYRTNLSNVTIIFGYSAKNIGTVIYFNKITNYNNINNRKSKKLRKKYNKLDPIQSENLIKELEEISKVLHDLRI